MPISRMCFTGQWQLAKDGFRLRKQIAWEMFTKIATEKSWFEDLPNVWVPIFIASYVNTTLNQIRNSDRSAWFDVIVWNLAPCQAWHCELFFFQGDENHQSCAVGQLTPWANISLKYPTLTPSALTLHPCIIFRSSPCLSRARFAPQSEKSNRSVLGHAECTVNQ